MVSNLTGHHQQRRVQGWCRRGAGRRPGTALGWELLITGVLIAGFQLLLDSRPTPSEQETPLMWPGGALFPGRRELRVPGRAGGGYLTGRRRALQHCAQCAGGDRLGLVIAWVPRPKSRAEPPRRRFHER